MMNMFFLLQSFADWLTYSILHLVPHSVIAGAVDFFIFDTLKIMLLMAIVIFVVSIIRSFLPKEKVRDILSHKKGYVANVLASLLGIITPFCSCSAVPLFLGFVEAGVPLGATFSFLVASPMINEVALVLLLGMFGWKIALLYISSGLVIAIASGAVIEKLDVKNLLEPSVPDKYKFGDDSGRLTWQRRIDIASKHTRYIVKKVWLYVIVGVGIGAWIHGYVPVDLLARYAGGGSWYSVPLAVVFGIPLYSNAAGVIPLVGALTEKGMSMGTALAFMMAVTGLSLPEFMILKKVMKTKLIVIFAGIVGIGIIFTGYLFNFILVH